MWLVSLVDGLTLKQNKTTTKHLLSLYPGGKVGFWPNLC